MKSGGQVPVMSIWLIEESTPGVIKCPESEFDCGRREMEGKSLCFNNPV